MSARSAYPPPPDFERKLALIPAVMPHSAVLTDAEGRIEWVNATFTRISGYALEEARGRKPGEMLQGRDTDREVIAQIRAALRARVGFEGEVYNYDKNGAGYWLALSITPIFDAQAELRGFVSVQTDITERKLAEQRLRESQEELERSARELARRNQELAQARDAALDAARLKSEFLANTSHEVRTPLNGIMGMAYLLSESELGAAQQQWARAIHASANALLVIINDILDFSKIEAGKLTLEHIPFDLRGLLRDIITLLAPRAHDRGLTLHLRWNDEPDTGGPRDDVAQKAALLYGDPGRVRQVLLNLVDNALKFTPPDGAITLAAQQPTTPTATASNAWRLSVRDTGIGIAPEQQERIFESFTQADGSTTRKYGGTGLGLTICRQLVGLMGGGITLHSVPGEGSVFTLEVPLPAHDSAEAQASVTDSEAGADVDLTEVFVQNASRALARCALALELEDGATLEHWAGCLKDDCETAGAARLAGLCARLEAMGRGGGLAQAAHLLQRLEEEWQALHSPAAADAIEARFAPPPHLRAA